MTTPNNNGTNDTTADAHKLFQQGFHVFPVDHPAQPKCIGAHSKIPCDGTRGKHPNVTWGTWAQTNTAQMIDRRWRKYQGIVNIGTACGPSDLVVLDEDQSGEIDRWRTRHGFVLPDTYTVTTGYGEHRYYHWDHKAQKIRNATLVDDYKFDVRGDGGFVVAEGSQHATGAIYTGNGLPMAELPTEVAAYLTAKRSDVQEHTPIALDKHGGVIKFHSRDNKLVSYAGRLRELGLDLHEAEPVFRQRWLDCEQPDGEIPEANYHRRGADCCGKEHYSVTWVEAIDKLNHVYRTYSASKATETNDSGTRDNRVLRLIAASEIVSDIPDWVWMTEGEGRVQRGVLTLFAGRPGAGKSTAARWFAAQWSRGLLGGYWEGKPQKVAYIASEEALDYVVKPGLQMAGADMSNIVFPSVEMNGEAIALMSDVDEYELTQQLISEGVTVIIVDPVMATIRKKVDIYRTNEMREGLQPFVRIAQRVNGTVIGVVHLVKGTTGDVVASINASSAFGEVARCVFGFAKDPDNEPERVMSQAKNSCGSEDLALTYEIDVQQFQADTGRVGVMPVFKITGQSDITVGDILAARGNQGKRALSPTAQRVVELVNSRTETSAAILVENGLAKNSNSATKLLNRLYQRGEIDNPIYGSYTPKITSRPKGVAS